MYYTTPSNARCNDNDNDNNNSNSAFEARTTRAEHTQSALVAVVLQPQLGTVRVSMRPVGFPSFASFRARRSWHNAVHIYVCGNGVVFPNKVGALLLWQTPNSSSSEDFADTPLKNIHIVGHQFSFA